MARITELMSAWPGNLLAIVAGLLIPFSLAPYDIWPLGILAPLILMLLLQNISSKTQLLRCFLFGVGMYGSGTSWVYVAIHDFAGTPPLLAFVMTAMFVLGLAFVFILPFILYTRFIPKHLIGNTLGFSTIWVLGEWLRSWLLTGFPWLYLGYAHIDTWLAGWAPIFGVFSLSFLAVLSGTLAYYTIKALLVEKAIKHAAITLIAIVACWLPGKLLLDIRWNIPADNTTEEISVAIVQPNIPLEVKWNPIYRDTILSILQEQTQAHLDKDLIFWPEAAIPLMYHDAQDFLYELDQLANSTNTGIITGILYDDLEKARYYNGIIGVGQAKGIYFKQRLVPFGEYVPLEEWLRGLITFFDLPNSIIHRGPKQQDILSHNGVKIAPSICYEIVYPDLVAQQASQSQLLVTISNDAWFGDSIGPKQHFQMAQMRALENQRYVIRATNTGISGVINPRGKISLLGNQFRRESISYTKVKLIDTITPFSRWGSLPIVILCFIILGGFILLHIRQKQLAVSNAL